MNPYAETDRAAKEGIKRSAEGAKAYRPFMKLCIRDAAATNAFLTMDEVLDVLESHIPKPTWNLMAFGALMQQAQKDGLIRKTGTKRKSRRSTQHREREVYQSLIFSPGAVVTRSGIQPLLIEYAEMEAAVRVPVALEG